MAHIERARLRRYLPHADGKANPWQWWAFDYIDDARSKRDLVAGPFDTRRELEALGRQREVAEPPPVAVTADVSASRCAYRA